MRKRTVSLAEAQQEFDAARKNYQENLGDEQALRRLHRAEDVYLSARRGDDHVFDSRPGGGWKR